MSTKPVTKRSDDRSQLRGRRADAAMTAEEIAEACGLTAHQVGRRVGRLIMVGKVEVVGSKVLSTGRAGRTYRRTR